MTWVGSWFQIRALCFRGKVVSVEAGPGLKVLPAASSYVYTDTMRRIAVAKLSQYKVAVRLERVQVPPAKSHHAQQERQRHTKCLHLMIWVSGSRV